MSKGFHESWRDFKPADPKTPFGGKTVAGENPDVATARKKVDRGTTRGAKRCIVDGTTLYEYATAKAHGIKGIHFQSRKEAKRWISLLEMERAGTVRNLQRQVRFSLQARRPDGLMAHICNYVADFTYDRVGASGAWEDGIVEDAKGFKEDLYMLKRDWFAAQYGKEILET